MQPTNTAPVTTMTTINITTSKTKSGATIKVALVPQDMAPGIEGQYAASDLAASHGCTHYRIVDTAGRILSAGKAHSTARYGSFGPDAG